MRNLEPKEKKKALISLIAGVAIGFLVVIVPFMVLRYNGRTVSDATVIRKAEELGMVKTTDIMTGYAEPVKEIKTPKVPNRYLKDLLILSAFLALAGVVFGFHFLMNKVFLN